jgi:hypothetical protein
MRREFAEAIEQFFYGESGCAGASGEFVGQLSELALALGIFSFHFFLRDERSCALVSFEKSSQFEFAVGAHDGVGIDGEVDRHLTDRGELISGSERTQSHTAAHLIDDLTVDGNAGVQVQFELEALTIGGSASHVLQCTIELVH